MSSRFPSKIAAAFYLGALIDGEGSVIHCKNTRYVSVCNTDPAIMDACVDALRVIGIDANAYMKPQRTVVGKPIYMLHICRRDELERVNAIVPIMAPLKKAKLARLLESYVLVRHTAEQLRRFYLEQQMSTKQLARYFGVSRVTVARWLKENGIPIRSIEERMAIRVAKANRKAA